MLGGGEVLRGPKGKWSMLTAALGLQRRPDDGAEGGCGERNGEEERRGADSSGGSGVVAVVVVVVVVVVVMVVVVVGGSVSMSHTAGLAVAERQKRAMETNAGACSSRRGVTAKGDRSDGGSFLLLVQDTTRHDTRASASSGATWAQSRPGAVKKAPFSDGVCRLMSALPHHADPCRSTHSPGTVPALSPAAPSRTSDSPMP